jgi:BlaI family transcriptional regulator, penicillinase repressor
LRKAKLNGFTRGERQIMDVLYKFERATVAQVLGGLADKSSYSTVRAQLRVPEHKGHVRHEEHGLRYVYVPEVPRGIAGRSALRHIVEIFFEGSVEKIIGILLAGEVSQLPREELDRLIQIVAKGRVDRRFLAETARRT